MGLRAGFVAHQVRITVRNPARVLKLLDQSKVRNLASAARAMPASGGWTTDGSRVATRLYRTYEDYVRHQRSKVSLFDTTAYDEQLRQELVRRLGPTRDWRAARVLCLAARNGGEVRAFVELGAFAVGIDLNPGTGNRYVLAGDFHDLQFADRSVDVVYTNALDHAFQLDRIAGEVRRVLRDDGEFVVDAILGNAEGEQSGYWESTAWGTTDDLVASLPGFTVRHRAPIEVPWKGTELRLGPDDP